MTTCSTTVTAVPVTAAVVVVVIAVSITLPGGLHADPVAVGGHRGIETLTLGTVIEVLVRTTAVSTVPFAPTIVVAVITGAITLPGRMRARSSASVLVVRILTFTFCTVIVLFVVSTAIAAVPVTATVVVAIITGHVALPRGMRTHSAARAMVGIQALTIGAVVVFLVGATAVATVPTTATVVVAIVAGVVSLPSWVGTRTTASRLLLWI